MLTLSQQMILSNAYTQNILSNNKQQLTDPIATNPHWQLHIITMPNNSTKIGPLLLLT